MVTGYEVRVMDEVGCVYRVWSEAQMAGGDTARFFGVVFVVTLCVVIGVLSDDLY